MSDESKPTAYNMSIHNNPDAGAWVKFFRVCNPDCNVPDDLMFGWFANAMMAMHDFLKGGGPINGDHAQYLIDQARGDGVDNGKARRPETDQMQSASTGDGGWPRPSGL